MLRNSMGVVVSEMGDVRKANIGEVRRMMGMWVSGLTMYNFIFMAGSIIWLALKNVCTLPCT